MGRLFDIDGGVMGTLGKLTDIILLSLLFIVFSIPIVTMGASFTAMYYTSVKCIRRGRSYIFQSFWKSFKENFKESTIIWLILIVMSLILSLNLWYSTKLISGTTGFILSCVYGMMGVSIALCCVYIFPVLSRFSMGVKKLIQTSFLVALKHLPYSVLMVLIFGVCVLAIFILPPLVFVLPAAGSLIFSLPMERILKKYTPASEDNSKDEWYLE